MSLNRGVIALAFPNVAVADARAQGANVASSTFASMDGYPEAQMSPEDDTLAYLYPIDDRRHGVMHRAEVGNNEVVEGTAAASR